MLSDPSNSVFLDVSGDPLQLWGQILSQINLTPNLLRLSIIQLQLSTYFHILVKHERIFRKKILTEKGKSQEE